MWYGTGIIHKKGQGKKSSFLSERSPRAMMYHSVLAMNCRCQLDWPIAQRTCGVQKPLLVVHFTIFHS